MSWTCYCPRCHNPIKVPNTKSGIIGCPHCSQRITLPDPTTPTPPATVHHEEEVEYEPQADGPEIFLGLIMLVAALIVVGNFIYHLFY